VKIKNPFHRATPVEKGQKNVKALGRQKASLRVEVLRNQREIKKQSAAKDAAMGRGDFKAAKQAILERRKLEADQDRLQGSITMVGEASRTVRDVTTQAVVNKTIKDAFKVVDKAMRSDGQTDKTMERWNDVREKMDMRNDQYSDMVGLVSQDAAAEQEADEEIRALAESMGETRIQPAQEHVQPVYNGEEPIAEEV